MMGENLVSAYDLMRFSFVTISSHFIQQILGIRFTFYNHNGHLNIMQW